MEEIGCTCIRFIGGELVGENASWGEGVWEGHTRKLKMIRLSHRWKRRCRGIVTSERDRGNQTKDRSHRKRTEPQKGKLETQN